METKKCIINGCENYATTTTRYCKEHLLEKKRNLAKQRYAATHKRTIYENKCIWCGKSFLASRKTTFCCSAVCSNALKAATKSTEHYKLSNARGKEAFLHKQLVVRALGEEALTNKDIHHKDFNTANNDLSNLLLLDRSTHSELHMYIRYEAARRTNPNDVNRVQLMRAMIPALTDEFLLAHKISNCTVADLVR